VEHRNDSDEPDEEQLKQEPEQEPAQEPEETLGASSGGGGAPSPARTRQPLVTRLERARGTPCAREAVVFFFSVIIQQRFVSQARLMKRAGFKNSNVP